MILFVSSLTASAQMRPWPRLSVFPNSVEVWINNFDNKTYRCSGTVWMFYESGRSRTEFVMMNVFPRQNAFHRIINYNRVERIRNATHTINCF